MSLRFMKTGKILATAKGSMSGGTLGVLGRLWVLGYA